MPFGTPFHVGHNQGGTGGTTSGPSVSNIEQDVPVGTLLVATWTAGTDQDLNTPSDSKGNTWTVPEELADTGTNVYSKRSYCRVTVALVAGVDTITGTWAANVGAPRAVSVDGFPGVLTTGTLAGIRDGNAGDNGNNLLADTVGVDPAEGAEIIIVSAVLRRRLASSAPTTPSGYNLLSDQGYDSGATNGSRRIMRYYKIKGGADEAAEDPQLDLGSTATGWTMSVQSFKADPGVTQVVKDFNIEWPILAQVDKDFDAEWSVGGIVAKDFNIEWGLDDIPTDVLGVVGKLALNPAGGAATATVRMTLTGEVPDGDTIVIGTGGQGAELVGVADQRGNDWLEDDDGSRLFPSYTADQWSSRLDTTLNVGDWVDLTFSAPVDPVVALAVRVRGVAGNATRVDRKGHNSGFTSAPTVSTDGVMDTADELLLATVMVATVDASAFGKPDGWEIIGKTDPVATSDTANRRVHMLWARASDTAVETFVATLGANRNWVAIITTLRPSPTVKVRKTFDVAHEIEGPVAKDFNIDWTLLERVDKTWTVEAAIEGATTEPVDKAPWRLRANPRWRSGTARLPRERSLSGTVRRHFEFMWPILGSVDKDYLAAWEILGTAGGGAIAVHRDFGFVWEIFSPEDDFDYLLFVSPDGDDSRTAVTAENLFTPVKTMKRAAAIARAATLVYCLDPTGATDTLGTAQRWDRTLEAITTPVSAKPTGGTVVVRNAPGHLPIIGGLRSTDQGDPIRDMRFEGVTSWGALNPHRAERVEVVGGHWHGPPSLPRQRDTAGNEIAGTGFGLYVLNLSTGSQDCTIRQAKVGGKPYVDYGVPSSWNGGQASEPGIHSIAEDPNYGWDYTCQVGVNATGGVASDEKHRNLVIKELDISYCTVLAVRHGSTERDPATGISTLVQDVRMTKILRSYTTYNPGDPHVDAIRTISASGSRAEGVIWRRLTVLDCEGIGYFTKDGRVVNMTIEACLGARMIGNFKVVELYNFEGGNMIGNTFLGGIVVKPQWAGSLTNMLWYMNIINSNAYDPVTTGGVAEPITWRYRGHNRIRAIATSGQRWTPDPFENELAWDYNQPNSWRFNDPDDYTPALGQNPVGAGVMTAAGVALDTLDNVLNHRNTPPTIGARETVPA